MPSDFAADIQSAHVWKYDIQQYQVILLLLRKLYAKSTVVGLVYLLGLFLQAFFNKRSYFRLVLNQ